MHNKTRLDSSHEIGGNEQKQILGVTGPATVWLYKETGGRRHGGLTGPDRLNDIARIIGYCWWEGVSESQGVYPGGRTLGKNVIYQTW